MLDLHSHILPGLDDGPGEIEAALTMARAAVKDGTTQMVATPHCFDGVYNCQRQEIIETCQFFNQRLQTENIPLVVHPGAEIRLVPEILELIEQGEVLTLGDRGRAILLELPNNFIPSAMNQLIREVGRRGLRVVVAHPERNLSIGKNFAIVEEMVQSGALMQITAQSLGRPLSWPRKTFADKLVLRGLAHLVASDCHNSRGRSPLMGAARRRISSLVGRERVGEMQEQAFILLG